ncbi:hypothetical protein BX600DRAFT_510995 [Xylariales sp. PMI_506]|nr:hypothetical protein BX600DRAFT_510995 [Xylariales sp. PMI_506]
MGTHGDYRGLPEQPGLEVDMRRQHSDAEGLQVAAYGTEAEGLQPVEAYQDNHKLSAATGYYQTTMDSQNHTYLDPSSGSTPVGAYGGPVAVGAGTTTSILPETEKQVQEPLVATAAKSSRKWWIIGGVAVAIVVILGAVLGGVLGSRAAKNSSSAADSSSSSSSSSGGGGNSTSSGNSTSLTNLRSLSHLAATGWRNEGHYRIRVFYQGPDGLLRYSSYASNESSWDEPVALGNLAYTAANDTPLAASISMEGAPYQYKLAYVDTNQTLRGQGIEDYEGAAASGASLLLNNYPITVASNSRLASYWPFFISQNNNGTLEWTRYYGSSAPNWWTHAPVDSEVSATNGSGLAIVPASSYFRNDQDGGFLYRTASGALSNYLYSTDNNLTGTAWSGFTLSMSIPADSPIAGFAVARASSSSNYTNTYILYQDAEGDIQVVWQDDTSGWKGPETYDAFAGADGGTDIACVTPGAWAATNSYLTSADDMSRCYFQAGGQLREVHYNGSDWINDGYLPIT